jgi:hypothetical protein
MQSLWDVPALEEYPHSVPAKVFHLWRRYRLQRTNTLRLELADIPPMALDMENKLWVCVDINLYDAPIIAWSDFQPDAVALHDPVPCTVTHFHFGASAIRAKVLAALEADLERRLQKGIHGSLLR